MFLKSLDIFGFKSFVDKTHIEFTDGITALMGENGCGKSNIIDAVKWVLGEQAASGFRVETMTDVIFSGTETRKALNVAEVTLTISNENSLLPMDASEIAIRRRIFRSGQNEYFINGAQCLRKDVLGLFQDTGIGKVAYSVLEQGKIDKILSDKPEDRRYLFEEAAEITRFKERFAKAQNDLAKAEENIRQVEATFSEVKKNYEVLEVQAQKAMRHRELNEKIFSLDCDIQLLRLKNFEDEVAQRQSRLAAASKERDDLDGQISALAESIKESADAVESFVTRLNALNAETLKLVGEQNVKKEQAKNIREKEAECESKIAEAENRRRGVEAKIEDLGDEVSDQQDAVGDYAKKIRSFEETIKSFGESIQIAADSIEEYQNRIRDLEAENKALSEKNAQIEESISKIDIGAELDLRISQTGYSSQKSQAALDVARASLSALQSEVSSKLGEARDFAKIPFASEEAAKNFAARNAQNLEGIEKNAKAARQNFDAFVSVAPTFVDEFLKPQGSITRKREFEKQIRENRAAQEKNIGEAASVAAKIAELKSSIEGYKDTLSESKANLKVAQVGEQSAKEKLNVLQSELSAAEQSLREMDDEIFSQKRRAEDLAEQSEIIEDEIAEIEKRGREIADEIVALNDEIASKKSGEKENAAALDEKRRARGDIQAEIERLNQAQLVDGTKAENVRANFREKYSRDLSEFEQRMDSISETPAALSKALAAAQDEFRGIGPVNYEAEMQFAQVKERYELLDRQLADWNKAKNDIQIIADETRAESAERFIKTYNQIKKNFHNVFRKLFGGGGQAELRLTDPKNVLESGIEILARPPGKKLDSLKPLSGGEKTMTAVALLFATYMVHPSPFCLLDEIDAALDNANVVRFAGALRDFADASQYIVITHNKTTGASADSLIGVTMEENGVSKIVQLQITDRGGGTKKIADIEPFCEEDVPDEEDVEIPPHPAKRFKNPQKPVGNIFMPKKPDEKASDA